MITAQKIKEVYEKIKTDIYKTPLVYSPVLSEYSGAEVYLKLEHYQRSGSFKMRGVLAKMNSLDSVDFEKVFVAASTGNHAAAFAHASRQYGFKGVLFLPENTSQVKVDAIKDFELEIIFHGRNSMETEVRAVNHAKAIGGLLVHPYNDPEIICGQGTIGLEIQEQQTDVDAILAPVGGGGLIAGLCTFFAGSPTQIIGCQPINGAEMHASIEQGKIVSPSPLITISDATSGGIEEGAITYDICKKGISDFELLDEVSIEKAVAFIAKYHHTIVEPASALPVAALMNSKKYRGKTLVLVLTGKKIKIELLIKILSKFSDVV